MTHQLRLLFSLFLFLPLASGCIYDDLSDCPQPLRLYFDIEFTYAETGIHPQAIGSMHLYIFDAQGVFCGEQTDFSPEVGPEYYMELPYLQPSTYHFVVWGNATAPYAVAPAQPQTGRSTKDQFFMNLMVPSNDTINITAAPLFYAGLSGAVVTGENNQRLRAPLTSTGNIIRVSTAGLSSGKRTARLAITDNNGRYTFDHTIADGGDFTYNTSCTQDAQGQLHASLQVLQLAADRHPQLELYDETAKQTLYKADLTALLNAIPGIDYKRMHEFDLLFTFDNTGSLVSVSVNGWTVVDDEEEL